MFLLAIKIAISQHLSREKNYLDLRYIDVYYSIEEKTMSTLKKRNGIYQYHHNHIRISLKTSDKKIALILRDQMDLKRLTGQLDTPRMKILGLTEKYIPYIASDDTISDNTKKKVTYQVNIFAEYIRTNNLNKYIDEITVDLFHRYATWRDIASLKNDMMSLNKMFRWGVSKGLTVQVTVPVADYVIKKSHKHRAITHEEFLRLYGNTHTKLYEFLYYTGLRPSDVIRIHSSMVEGYGRLLTLTPQKTANSSGKVIVMPLNKRIGVSAPPTDDFFYFPTYLANPNLLDSARREIKKILGKEVTLYSLRYSFNARLKELGASIELRKDAMGHTNIRTTEGYSTPEVSQLASYIDRMD